MRKIAAGEFKAKCLKLMDEVRDTGTEIVVTKRGEVVCKVVPAKRKARPLFGCMKGTVKIVGDIIEPIDVEWEVNK